LYEKNKTIDVTLLCQEEEGEHCHRHLVKDLIDRCINGLPKLLDEQNVLQYEEEMSTFDELLGDAMSDIHVDATGRTQIKDSQIDNIMTHKLKGILDKLLEHWNIIMTYTNLIKLHWVESKGRIIS
jgi:uncharacterized protein (DUF488 family)